MWGKAFPHALKGQKLLAQGIALGLIQQQQSRPERAKAFYFKAFALSVKKLSLPTVVREVKRQ